MPHAADLPSLPADSIFTRACLTAACLLLALGCRESRAPTELPPEAPQEAVHVQVLAAEYRRGSAAMLDLVNDSTVTVGSNACPSRMEVLVGGDAWGRVPNYPVGCLAVWIVVEPGQRGRLLAPLPMSLLPGTYRTYHEVGIGTSRVAHGRYSRPFEVR